VFAVLLGIQFLVLGAGRLVHSFAVDHTRAGSRYLLAVLGSFSIGAGVLCLRHPMRTVIALTVLVGLFWLIGGLIELVRATTERSRQSGLDVLCGCLGMVTGLMLLSWPHPTMLVLTVLLGLRLMISGVLMIAA
jgi:uncharacterized membrane protein HdeD (DUF308 family)